MAVKRKEFQRLADMLRLFLLKLPEGSDLAELRDCVHLSLFLMQKYFRQIQQKVRESNPLAHSVQPGQFQGKIGVSLDSKFAYDWCEASPSPSARATLQLTKAELTEMTTLPLVIQAAKDGDLALLGDLAKRDPDRLAEPDIYGRSALFYAVQFGHLAALRFLLDNGVSPDDQCHENSVPLHLAAFKGDTDSVRMLLAANCDFNCEDSYGRSALHWACVPPSTELVKLLLSAGAIPSTRDRDGMTPVMWACHHDYINHVTVLLESSNGHYDVEEEDGIERDNIGRTWLHWAVSADGNQEVGKALMDDRMVRVGDVDGRTPFLYAAESGSASGVKMLLKLLPEPQLNMTDSSGRYATHLAVNAGHGHCLALLLESGLPWDSRDSQGVTPLDVARRYQLSYCLRLLNCHAATKQQPQNVKHIAPPAVPSSPPPVAKRRPGVRRQFTVTQSDQNMKLQQLETMARSHPPRIEQQDSMECEGYPDLFPNLSPTIPSRHNVSSPQSSHSASSTRPVKAVYLSSTPVMDRADSPETDESQRTVLRRPGMRSPASSAGSQRLSSADEPFRRSAEGSRASLDSASRISGASYDNDTPQPPEKVSLLSSSPRHWGNPHANAPPLPRGHSPMRVLSEDTTLPSLKPNQLAPLPRRGGGSGQEPRRRSRKSPSPTAPLQPISRSPQRDGRQELYQQQREPEDHHTRDLRQQRQEQERGGEMDACEGEDMGQGPDLRPSSRRGNLQRPNSGPNALPPARLNRRAKETGKLRQQDSGDWG